MNPEHLLELATNEVASQTSGAPRQAVLRRSGSSAYYALFHQLLWTIATTFVPAAHWKARVLFYRALDHGRTKQRCKHAGQDPMPKAEQLFFGFESFPLEIRRFCNAFSDLQELRNRCDYDPEYKITKDVALYAINASSDAIDDLKAADEASRTLFLSYLLFGMRS